MSFFRKNKEKIMVATIAIALIVLIGVTSKDRIEITKFEQVLGNIFMPIGKTTNTLGKKVSDFFTGIGGISTLKDENEKLKENLIQLEDENRNLLNIIGKTDYLKKEANLLKETNFNLIESKIVGKEPGNWFDRFTIDKGLKDGIKKGDTVIQGIEIEDNTISEGLIGRVVDVGPNWAKVITIVDELSKISFKILRTQDGGMISGSMDSKTTGYRKVTGYLFDDEADIIKGDKIYTSELGGAFVSDLYIGEVDAVINDDEDMMKKIEVKPAINFKKLYKVYVISN